MNLAPWVASGFLWKEAMLTNLVTGSSQLCKYRQKEKGQLGAVLREERTRGRTSQNVARSKLLSVLANRNKAIPGVWETDHQMGWSLLLDKISEQKEKWRFLVKSML